MSMSSKMPAIVLKVAGKLHKTALPLYQSSARAAFIPACKIRKGKRLLYFGRNPGRLVAATVFIQLIGGSPHCKAKAFIMGGAGRLVLQGAGRILENPVVLGLCNDHDTICTCAIVQQEC
eukprot:scaffold4522_cov141-Skeletonema_menzelii.AAC.15